MKFTQAGGIPREEFAKILAAAPGRAGTASEKKHRVLVFSLAFGFKHSAIPYGKAALEVLAKKTGAFEAEFSDDPAAFEPENLKRFDAVVFNSTNNEVFLPEQFKTLSPEAKKKALARDARLKESFRAFVAGGGGLAVIHAGVATFRKWPEFGKIMGARFDNHPWYAGSTVTLRVTEPDHPAVQAFKGSPFFEVTDEIYQLKEFSTDDIRVLLRVDLEKTQVTPGQRKVFHREDGLFPITYVKRYGKGRIFYCALGHQHDIYWNPVVLRHFLEGIRFVLRELDGPDTP